MLRLTRYISSSSRILNVGGPFIDHLVLDQLRDSSKLNSPSSILILDPKTIKNNSKRNPFPNQKNVPPKLVPNIFKDDDLQGSDSYIKLINNLRVHQNKVSDDRHKSITSLLTESFTASQLRNYIRQYYDSEEFQGQKLGVSRKTKRQLCNIIIQDLWNIKRSGLKTSVEDLMITKEVKLGKKDLFLLLYKDGLLIKYLSRTGCGISFNSSDDTIKFTGTESQINSANIILDSIIVNSFQKNVDLSTVIPLFEEKFGGFDPAQLSQLLQVHIEPVSESIYRFTSFNENQHKRAKRLLLWYLDYNTRVVSEVKVPGCYGEGYYLPVRDDESIEWTERGGSLFRLIGHTGPKGQCGPGSSSPSPSPSPGPGPGPGSSASPSEPSVQMASPIEQQLTLFNNTNPNLNTHEIDELKSFLTPPTIHHQSDNLTDAKNPKTGDIITVSERNEIFNSLATFNVADPPPVFTATIGNVLFDIPSHDIIPSHKRTKEHTTTKEPVEKKVLFNSGVPLVNDQILNLPYFNNPSLTTKDINTFRIVDPHEYTVQLKFQPSLLDNQPTSLPPVEVWVNVNKFGTLDLSSLRLLTVEKENNCYIALPDKLADLKVSSQSVGDLFGEELLEQEDSSSIQSLLNSTTQKYAKFREQPGLEQFLEQSILDFSGKTKPVVHPTLELKINGILTVYQYISMNYRRLLEFLYRGKLLQFSMIEGGSLGGRRSEVVVVGNEFDRALMDELIDDGIELIESLDKDN